MSHAYFVSCLIVIDEYFALSPITGRILEIKSSRFAKYLREFSGQTQFIVVTHREGTMEECDLLYGATMQQKGVTKLVSVKLKDAIDLAQNAS